MLTCKCYAVLRDATLRVAGGACLEHVKRGVKKRSLGFDLSRSQRVCFETRRENAIDLMRLSDKISDLPKLPLNDNVGWIELCRGHRRPYSGL